jgi:hypothetical protein
MKANPNGSVNPAAPYSNFRQVFQVVILPL